MQKILPILLVTLLVWNVFPQNSNLLFHIERSTNKNKVYYEVKQGKDGVLDSKVPVVAYWVMWQKDSTGKTREDLNGVEKKMAYGFKIEPVTGSQHKILKLVSCPKRPIDIYVSKGKAVAEMTINGKPAILEKMFISSKESILLPKVKYLELFGKDVVSGEPCYEKIIP